MTSLRRLDVTTFTRFFIGGYGPLQTTKERLMAALLVGMSVMLVFAAAVHVLYAAAWVLRWIVEFSTRTVPRAEAGVELAILVGQLCAVSFAAVTLLFVVKTVAERLGGMKYRPSPIPARETLRDQDSPQ